MHVVLVDEVEYLDADYFAQVILPMYVDAGSTCIAVGTY
jgi:hypothetical protein